MRRLLGVRHRDAEAPASGDFGENPIGYLIFTKSRMMAILAAGDRKPWVTVEDRARLMTSMAAYTGTYRLEGDKWITTVDVAWNPSYPREAVRYYKIKGDHLSVLTDWMDDARFPQQKVRQVLTWRKVEQGHKQFRDLGLLYRSVLSPASSNFNRGGVLLRLSTER